MRYNIATLLFLFSFSLSACITIDQAGDETTPAQRNDYTESYDTSSHINSRNTQPQIIEIIGMDSIQEISNNRPIILEVTGMNSEITVLRGTPVEEVTITGMNSVVYLPEGTYPETNIIGMNSRIEYY